MNPSHFYDGVFLALLLLGAAFFGAGMVLELLRGER